jgi:predicted nucleic acid-binding protein
MEKLIADTNIIIYSIKGIAAVEPYVMEYDLAVSEITVIELFGVKGIDDFTLNKRKKFIKTCSLLPFNAEIREIAISIKQAYTIKVPDAIIAATSIHYGLTLLTADTDFKKLKELTSILIQL